MKIRLLRYSDNGNSTLGLLFVDNTFFAHTLEDEFRDIKVMGETRIPHGRYGIIKREVMSKMTKRYMSLCTCSTVFPLTWTRFNVSHYAPTSCLIVSGRSDIACACEYKHSSNRWIKSRWCVDVSDIIFRQVTVDPRLGQGTDNRPFK